MSSVTVSNKYQALTSEEEDEGEEEDNSEELRELPIDTIDCRLIQSSKNNERRRTRKKEVEREQLVDTACGFGVDTRSTQPGRVRECMKKGMRSLAEIEPEGLKATSQEEWTEIEFSVDSGAAETVIGEDMALNVDLEEGAKFKKGVQYEIASGELIPNLGEKRMEATTDQGVVRGIKAQVCAVNKGLLSVAKMTEAGHKVVFSKHEAYIEDEETGERMKLVERNGMYTLRMWAKPVFSGHGRNQ